MTEQEIIEILKTNEPFEGLAGVSAIFPEDQDESQADLRFDLKFGGNQIAVYAEVKSACTPKLTQQIVAWLAKMKSLRADSAFALICPYLSPESQSICIDNNVDFVDLSGNIYMNVAGRLLIQRTGLKNRTRQRRPFPNPFSGRSSRVVRVLLEAPAKEWTISELAAGVVDQDLRNQLGIEDFRVSIATVSKAVSGLEEQLLIRRANSAVKVPEPKRLLMKWAELYKNRYRWYLRRAFTCSNPFGSDLAAVTKGLRKLAAKAPFAFSGSAAASLTAPFVDLDVIDLFISEDTLPQGLRQFPSGDSLGPDLRVIYPYDMGVFMYAQLISGVPVVSDVQAYLDAFASGGRDQKQAEYLLSRNIEPRWS